MHRNRTPLVLAVVGAVLALDADAETTPDRPRFAGVAGVVLGAAIAVAAGWLAVGSVGLRTVLLGLAVGAVALALPAGAAADRSERLRTLGLAAALVVPFVGVTLHGALGGGGMGAAFTVLGAVLLVVLDVLVASPVYRLGQSLGATTSTFTRSGSSQYSA